MTLRTGTTRSLSSTSPARSHTPGIAITLRMGVGGVQAGLAATAELFNKLLAEIGDAE